MAVNLQAVLDAPIIELDIIDSTNNYAMRLTDADKAQTGFTVTALQQTEGKGQRGRLWLDTFGENLLMSIITQPNCTLEHQFAFSATVATAVATAIKNLYKLENINIKWPNDIIVNDKKAGGILIENVIRGNTWLNAVVGIGLNVNQQYFDEQLPNATSLYASTGECLLLQQVRDAVRTSVLQATNALNEVNVTLALYNDMLYKRGCRQAFVNEDGQMFEAEIIGVNNRGELMVVTQDGNETTFVHGTVQWKW